jgi:hypothetical protein
MIFPVQGRIRRQSDVIQNQLVIGVTPETVGLVVNANHQASTTEVVQKIFGIDVTAKFIVYVEPTQAAIDCFSGLDGRGVWEYGGVMFDVKGVQINVYGRSTDHIVFAANQRKA